MNETLSKLQGVHMLGLLFVLLLAAHLMRPADELVSNSANYMLAALLTALHVGPDRSSLRD
jgi:hypothetical protein